MTPRGVPLPPPPPILDAPEEILRGLQEMGPIPGSYEIPPAPVSPVHQAVLEQPHPLPVMEGVMNKEGPFTQRERQRVMERRERVNSPSPLRPGPPPLNPATVEKAPTPHEYTASMGTEPQTIDTKQPQKERPGAEKVERKEKKEEAPKQGERASIVPPWS